MSETPEDENNISFHYRFSFKDGSEKTFTIQLNKKTLNLVSTKKDEHPDWTELGHNQCSNCPLDEFKHDRCPVAENLVDLVDFFKDFKSFDEADIMIMSGERGYFKQNTPMQKGISSMLGIYMVSSGCPIMEKLKPMVRFHLPFGTMEETEYRTISMYAVAQLLRQKKGLKTDWEMKDLVKIFEGVNTVNASFTERLRSSGIDDASLNAVVILDCFAHNTSFKIDTNKIMDMLEDMFQPYLEE